MTQGSKTRSATVVPALLVSAVAVWLTGVALSALAPNQAKPAEAAGQPSAAAGAARVEEEFIQAAESAIEQVCRMCHPIENVLRLRRTSREWTDVLTTMAGRGANASDEQFEMIHKYLTRYYGRVRVNSAPADELSAVLGLTAKDAGALVEFRKSHGRFADVAAVLKVEGIDKAKIEEQPDALVFD